MPRESTVEARLRRKIEALGGLCLKWVCPGHAGIPDRIILLPEARIYFIELKKKGEKPTKLQAWWLKRLRKLGFNADYVAGTEGVNAFLKELEVWK